MKRITVRVILQKILQRHALLWTILSYNVVYCEKYFLIQYYVLLWTILPYTIFYCNNTALYCVLLWRVLPCTVFYCEIYCFILCITVNNTDLYSVLLWTYCLKQCFTVNSTVLYSYLLWPTLLCHATNSVAVMSYMKIIRVPCYFIKLL